MKNAKRSHIFMNGVVRIFALVLSAGYAAAGPAYPLKLSPGQHYMVDQNGTPFLVLGASPWYLTELLNGSNADYYLSVRASQGYNSIILDIAANGSVEDDSVPTNIYGQLPFTNIISGHTNLLSWNTSYFTNVDWVINDASNYGICCFCYPLYDGYPDNGTPPGGISWYQQMTGNTTNTLYSYGQFIGNRYKNYPNIVWVGAGDYNESGAPTTNLWNWLAAGIRSMDTNHLFTAQPQRGTQAYLEYTNFVNLEATYPGQFTYDEAKLDYQLSPVLASFDREPYYEYNATYNFNALNCRQFAYWAVLYGDTSGQFYGNEHEWPLASGWQTQIVDTVAVTVPNLGKLLNTRLWYNLVPDFNHTVVTNGYGTDGGSNFVTAAREVSGKTVIAYIPQNDPTITVAMTNISGSTATAWWFNPTNAADTLIGSYRTTGSQTFTPPDSNDWVLVLDDASQNYPPPGTPAKVSLGIEALGGSVYGLTVTGMAGQAYALQYTTSLNALWQALGSGTIGSSGTTSYSVISLTSNVFFRALNQ
ncbi:MAG: DUF4038 domain-containing protein [Verrucomicrobiia bacterium]